jgi:hypothetical protein
MWDLIYFETRVTDQTFIHKKKTGVGLDYHVAFQTVLYSIPFFKRIKINSLKTKINMK